jgi:hypothetical protein
MGRRATVQHIHKGRGTAGTISRRFQSAPTGPTSPRNGSGISTGVVQGTWVRHEGAVGAAARRRDGRLSASPRRSRAGAHCSRGATDDRSRRFQLSSRSVFASTMSPMSRGRGPTPASRTHSLAVGVAGQAPARPLGRQGPPAPAIGDHHEKLGPSTILGTRQSLVRVHGRTAVSLLVRDTAFVPLPRISGASGSSSTPAWTRRSTTRLSIHANVT